MEEVKTPVWRINYAGTDITLPIAHMVTDVTYTDHAEGKSDDLEITLEDSSARWRGSWYPAKGDKINVMFGYNGEPLVSTGDFEVDEVEFSGPPDVVKIRALSTGISSPLRTANNASFEGVSLLQIVGNIAAKHNLTVQGLDDGFIIDRVTQNNETDLAFLERLARAYGYAFVVRGGALCFYSIEELTGAASVYTIKRNICTGYSLKDSVAGKITSQAVSYYNQDAGEMVAADAEKATDSHDTGTSYGRVSSVAQADAIAKAGMLRASLMMRTGSIDLIGAPKLLAGVVVELAGWAGLDGKYLVSKSTHKMSRGGYLTSLEVAQCMN